MPNASLSRFNWLWPLAAGLGYSACMLLAGPPLSWWPLSLLAMLPVVWVGTREGARPWRDGLLVAVGSVPVWAVTQWWIVSVSAFGYYPMVLAQAAFVGMFVAMLILVRRTLPKLDLQFAVPLLWTGLEFCRGEIVFGGYAWGFVAHPLIESIGATLLASKGGFYAVSGWVAWTTGMFVQCVLDTRERRGKGVFGGVAAALMVLAMLAPEVWRTPARFKATNIAIVQTNIPQSNKIAWSVAEELAAMDRFEVLSREAAAAAPAFIVWPETMMPGLSLEPSAIAELKAKGIFFRVPGPSGETELEADAFATRLFALSRDAATPMLIGEEGWVGLNINQGDNGLEFNKQHRYNSVYLVRDGAASPVRYDKMHLTPFGEEMPYIKHWPWLQQQFLDLAAAGMAFDLSSGTRRTVFEIAAKGGTIRAVTPICFESTSASVCRSLVYEGGQRRADVIVNMTNDGWFGNSDLARAQHLQVARWRAVELGTPVVRAANTGVSAIIDARGRVVKSGVDGSPGAARVDGILTGDITLGAGTTLYGRIGDVAGWVCFVGGLVLSLVAMWRAWRSQRTPAKAAP